MKIILRLKGSSSSGNYGHAGRPGEVGGSAGNMISVSGDADWMSTRESFKQAISKNLAPGLKLTVGKPYREGKFTTVTFDVEASGGYAQAVLWYDRMSKEVKVQQQDMSLPESARGKGIGGAMIEALVAGYKAIGVNNIPIHVDTNPDFWNHMKKKYPGIYRDE